MWIDTHCHLDFIYENKSKDESLFDNSLLDFIICPSANHKSFNILKRLNQKNKIMINRRKVLQSLATLPFAGSLLGAQSLSAQSKTAAVVSSLRRDFFKELGLRTFINAAGTYTSMTGSLMPKEVIEAISYGATEYVNLDDLQDKVGERIAELLECEYATISSEIALNPKPKSEV